MSKYSDEQLKEMALDVLYAYHSGTDERIMPFFMAMMTLTGLSPEQIMYKVQELANK